MTANCSALARVTSLCLTALALAVPGEIADAQEPFRPPRADSVSVSVLPSTDASEGGVEYRYRLSLSETSQQMLDAFGVMVPRNGVAAIETPSGWEEFFPWEPDTWARIFPDRQEYQVLLWANVDSMSRLTPGAEASGFVFGSRHLPGTALFWAQGFVPVPTFRRGAMPDSVVDASLFENSVSDTTIGPVVPPEAVDEPAEIVGQMEELLAFACRRDWIANRGICNSLSRKLEQVGRSIDRDRAKTARNQLRAFRSELEAQRGKHVDESAFSVLDLYARRLAERL